MRNELMLCRNETARPPRQFLQGPSAVPPRWRNVPSADRVALSVEWAEFVWQLRLLPHNIITTYIISPLFRPVDGNASFAEPCPRNGWFLAIGALIHRMC